MSVINLQFNMKNIYPNLEKPAERMMTHAIIVLIGYLGLLFTCLSLFFDRLDWLLLYL